MQLVSKRLCIRKLTVNDADRVSRIRNHPLVSKFQSPWSPEQALSMINKMRILNPAVVRNAWFQFGIELLENEELIGDIGFLHEDDNGKSWIGFTLHPHSWGKGFAAESVVEVMEFYRLLGVTQVWASIDPENRNSAKLLSRLHFSLAESKEDDLVFCKDLKRKDE